MLLPTPLLHRKINANKGDFGHILILAGSLKFSGAAVLCGFACMRSGAGLVTLGIPKGISNSVLRIKLPELMLLPLSQTKSKSLSLSSFKQIKNFAKKADIVVIGPGLSKDRQTLKLVLKVVKEISKPMVVDADGLNAIASSLRTLRTAASEKGRIIILTPHPGEMARLLGKSIKFVQKERKYIAKSFANEYNCIVVLKGNKSVVAAPGKKNYINHTGNPGMATAGSGDVLTGMIAGLLGQQLEPFQAAQYGVYLHGLSADLAAKEKTQISLIASDIIEKIPEAIKKHCRHSSVGRAAVL